VRTASCACGAIRVTATGSPAVVNACACFDCQKQTGSAFTYTAFFPVSGVTIEGEARIWRETRAAGRWHETHFCPTCGVPIVGKLEVFPELLGISVGCFADPEFDPPGGFYWASRRHRWVPLPDGVPASETQ
jgi:hypothetical protein